LIPDQRAARQKVRAILQGNAKPGAHAADASHLSEAAETGCGYFITHDKRMLKKRTELHAVLPPSLNIVTLEEFLEIFDAYGAGKAM
jgi:predicted nucleic acid-binding protein